MLGLLRRIASRNDTLISYGLDVYLCVYLSTVPAQAGVRRQESSPYIETIKMFFYAYIFCGQTQGLPLHITCYLLLITHYCIYIPDTTLFLLSFSFFFSIS